MRILIHVLGLLAFLVGCSSTPPPAPTFGAKAAGHGIVLAGTLATVGAADELTAASYTRLALLRHNAASRLSDGRISVETAKHIQVIADQARSQLDGAIAADRAGDKPLALKRLSGANELIAIGTAQLEVAP